MNKKILFPIFFLIAILQSCTQFKENKYFRHSDSEVKFELLDLYIVPFNLNVDGTRVGGISGIDWMYDNTFITISDDRSAYSPARAYQLEIHQSNYLIDSVNFSSPIFLKKPDGSLFDLDEVDPEAIRYHTAAHTFLYSSEGGRQENIQYPFVWEMDKSGNYLRHFDIPSIFDFGEYSGTRTNGGFESLTLENDTIVWYANELPLKQDGKVPSFEKGFYPIRLVRHDIKNDTVLNQFIYNVDSVFAKPIKSDGFYINSVPEILYINAKELWVLERAYVSGVGNHIKLFRLSTENAVDVNSKETLVGQETSQLKKELLIDFSSFDHKPDNIEGMSIGPKLADGRSSFYFIADNNFSEEQKTQIWFFAVSGLAAIN